MLIFGLSSLGILDGHHNSTHLYTMHRFAFFATILFALAFGRHISLAPPLLVEDIPVIASHRAELPTSFGQYDYIGHLDVENLTVTLPLYEATAEGENQSRWYIITDVSDLGLSQRFRLNYVPQLRFAPNDLVRNATLTREAGREILNIMGGVVDFSPVRSVGEIDNATGLPQNATAGSRGDENYSPLIRLEGTDVVYNAPFVATGNAEDLNQYCDQLPEEDAYENLHDSIVRICPRDLTATFRLVPSFSMGKLVLILPISASNEAIAAINFATYVPRLGELGIEGEAEQVEAEGEQPQPNQFWQEPGEVELEFTLEEAETRLRQMNEALPSPFSPLQAVYIISNGYSNADLQEGIGGQFLQNHPHRQGLRNVEDEGFIFPVLEGIPFMTQRYSPLWEIFLLEWTQESIDNGFRVRITDEMQALNYVFKNMMISSGLEEVEAEAEAPQELQFEASGIVLNFPVVGRLW